MAAAGELRALMNLAAPVLQTYAALSMLFCLYAARVQNQSGRKAARSLNRRLACLFVAGSVVYWAVLIPLKQPLFHFLYNGKYHGVRVPNSIVCTRNHDMEREPRTSDFVAGHGVARSLFVANGAASAVANRDRNSRSFFGLQG